jgi:hypothetical protein
MEEMTRVFRFFLAPTTLERRMRKRVEAALALKTVVLLAEYNRIWQPQIAICEQVAFQELACRDLERAGLPLVPLKVSKGKEERFLPVLTKYALGTIWHADTLDPEFEAELLSFPESAHDDWVESLTFAVAGLQKEIRDAWSPDLGSAAHWGRSVLPHEKPKTIGYEYNYLSGRCDKPFDFDELTGLFKAVLKPESDEPMSLERAIINYAEALAVHFFPQGRQTGQGWEMRQGLNVRLCEPVVFFDTRLSSSGDFLHLLVHCQVATSREDAQTQVEKFLCAKGVKLKE